VPIATLLESGLSKTRLAEEKKHKQFPAQKKTNPLSKNDFTFRGPVPSFLKSPKEI